MIYDTWETKLEAERLRLSSPETVYAWLKELAPAANAFRENVAPVIVRTLLSRQDPLVDLGLARYASIHELLLPLWRKGGLLRLALLANRARGPIMPPDDLGETIEALDTDGVAALYANPAIDPFHLERTFRNEFKLSGDRHWLASAHAIRNERLRHTLEDDTLNQMLDAIDHLRPIHAIWDLFRTMPPTERWASVLSKTGDIVYQVSLPKEVMPDLSTAEGREDWKRTSSKRYEAYHLWLEKQVLGRWANPPDKKDDPNSAWQRARAAYAEAVCRSNPHQPRITADHPDQGFRQGYYRGAHVNSSWDVRSMFKRDKAAFLGEVIWNDSLYERAVTTIRSQVRWFCRDRSIDDDMYSSWLSGREKELVAKNPGRYGDATEQDLGNE